MEKYGKRGEENVLRLWSSACREEFRLNYLGEFVFIGRNAARPSRTVLTVRPASASPNLCYTKKIKV